ncbi:unnamed protein product [Zymoseptoria tritici ST99CH_1E4]|uniref:Uncharacterized protein n=1 Tax=Zymoseptoria tritici ST99CH_1E4 TaxID=1276532 RepID=A0A2H1GAZ8_ZYMTR|nr:unnamed protein product [Zymoseptoria tritici ST99CH_1E4]
MFHAFASALLPQQTTSIPFLQRRNLKAEGMKRVLLILSGREQGNMQLVEDVIDNICELIYERTAPRLQIYTPTIFVHPASIPPRFGKCPLLKQISHELRRAIFAELLPAKDVVIQPVCQEGDKVKRDLTRKPKHNKTSNLLCLNRQVKDEMTSCVYAERIFAIHVHEGITTGGIEFLDSGRQPLQYKENAGNGDDRFARFDDGSEFDIHKLKKIEITIFPATEKARHAALNTYYMNYALARMLERGGKDGRVVSLTINFASQPEGHAQAQKNRRGIMRCEHWWWDPESDKPRSTSINNVTDVELALQPFAILTHVHNVSINLPSKVKTHPALVKFVEDLKHSMQSKQLGGTLGPRDGLEFQAEVLRTELYEYICSLKWGGTGQKLADMNEEDMYDETDPASNFDDDTDSNKHGRSFSSQNLSGGMDKRAKRFDEDEDEDDDEDGLDMQTALMEGFETKKKSSDTKVTRKSAYAPSSCLSDSPPRSTRSETFDFDCKNTGRKLGSIPGMDASQRAGDPIRSLGLASEIRRRTEMALKVEVDAARSRGPPIDSAVTGTFPTSHDSSSSPYSGGSQTLSSYDASPPGSHGKLGDAQSEEHTLHGNGLLQDLSSQRLQRRPPPPQHGHRRDRQHQRQHRSSLPSSYTFANHNTQPNNGLIDLTGDDDADLSDTPPQDSTRAHCRRSTNSDATPTGHVSRIPRYVPGATASTFIAMPPQLVQGQRNANGSQYTNGSAWGTLDLPRPGPLRGPAPESPSDDEGGGDDNPV